MRRILLFSLAVMLLLGLTLTVCSAMVKEPATGMEFNSEMKSQNKDLSLTGTDVRTKFFMKIYAVGHYGAADALSHEATPEKNLEYWMNAKVAKAFVLKFTFNVSSKQIQDAWNEGLTKANYTGKNKTSLLDSFKSDLPKGTVLHFEASADGQLTAIQNDKVLGTWKDADMVRALWSIWMGKNSVVTNKSNLVKVKPPAPAVKK
jgi:hypothetical protein